MSEQVQEQENQELLFPEAPASWNTRYVHPSGFECQITLRAESGIDLMSKVEKATAYMIEHGCEPYLYRLSCSKGQIERENKDSPAWCPTHKCLMRRWEKDGKAWYSHKVNGEWCNGK